MAYAGFGPASKALRERANPAKAGGIQAYSGRTLKAPPKTWQKPAPRGHVPSHAHDAAIREILETVRATAARIDALQDALRDYGD